MRCFLAFLSNVFIWFKNSSVKEFHLFTENVFLKNDQLVINFAIKFVAWTGFEFKARLIIKDFQKSLVKIFT